MGDAKILIACEESGIVTNEFRKLGFFNTFSCDIRPTCGGHPEWHIQRDVVEILNENWDMIIAFPPCTDLAVSGALRFKEKIQNGKQQKSIDFFMLFANNKCPKIAIENPIGIMSTIWRKPDQIVQPWMYGHPESKATCFWLKGLPILKSTNIAEFNRYRCKCGNVFDVSLGNDGCCIDQIAKPLWNNQTKSGQNKLAPSPDRAKKRGITYTGIAHAMADQWTK